MAEVKTLHIEKITWLDHTAFEVNHWHSINEAMTLEPLVIETLGWVLKETKDYIIVAATLGTNDTTAGEFLILKKVITARKRLK